MRCLILWMSLARMIIRLRTLMMRMFLRFQNAKSEGGWGYADESTDSILSGSIRIRMTMGLRDRCLRIVLDWITRAARRACQVSNVQRIHLSWEECSSVLSGSVTGKCCQVKNRRYSKHRLLTTISSSTIAIHCDSL